jgi:hypothetical protein
MKIDKIPEYELSKDQTSAIGELFKAVFEGYPEDFIYYNQVPDFRFLAWNDDKLVGHVGVHFRKICVGGTILSVFGIVDLCVATDNQLTNVGSNLIHEVYDLGLKNNVDFLVLTSDEDEFYLKNGFQVVKNPCRWLVIHNHVSMGVLKRTLNHGLMVKPINQATWPAGELDFMGHMF